MHQKRLSLTVADSGVDCCGPRAVDDNGERICGGVGRRDACAVAERDSKTGGRRAPAAEPTETCRRLRFFFALERAVSVLRAGARLADDEPHVLGWRLAPRHRDDLK